MNKKLSNATPGRPATIAAPRETILVQAARLFANNGYEGTSLQDIAKAVGISKAAVYHYFPTKQVIFEAIVAGLLERLFTKVQSSIEHSNDFGAQLRQLMVAHARFFEENYTEFVTFLHGFGGLKRDIGTIEGSVRDQYETTVRDLIAAAQSDGAFVASDPAIAARAILSMLNWMARWYRPHGPIRAEQFAADYFLLIYNGLRPR